MPGAVYTLFRNAILGEQQVVCLYGGRLRELCPHIIGTNKRGEEVVLAWQFAGESSGPLPQFLRSGQDGRRGGARADLAAEKLAG